MTEFRDAIRAAGLDPPEVIEPGRLHRFSTNGKRGDNGGWCKLFPDMTGGVFGDHRTGLSQVWQAKRDKPFTQVELAEFKQRCEQEKRECQVEQERRHTEAAAKAWAIWDAAQLAPVDHPY